MAGIINSIPARLALIVGGAQLLLLPFLYVQLTKTVYESDSEQFVNDVRSYSRFLADALDGQIRSLDDPIANEFLDQIALSQDVVYAELRDDQSGVVSEFSARRSLELIDDLRFGENGDDLYIIRIPIQSTDGATISLNLGFDERPTLELIDQVERRVVTAATIFFGVSVFLTIVLSLFVARPLRALRQVSQRIAEQEFSERFRVRSSIREIQELAHDLELMRSRLVEANRRLENEISEREVAESARRELEQTLRHVDKLETVGTLAGGIAHEINNALQPIRLYTELALDSVPSDGNGRKDLGRVLNAADRAKRIVEQILTFSRRSSDDDFDHVDIRSVVSDAVDFVRDLFSSSVTIEYHENTDDAIVLGSAIQIHQLVTNLCNNAYAAVPKQGGRIDVTVSRAFVSRSDNELLEDSISEEYATIEVADNGHGMDPLTIDRIFEPFFTTRQPGEGSGLGMSVVHGIVKSHGGFIRVRSELDKGTVFLVYLPLIDAAVEVS